MWLVVPRVAGRRHEPHHLQCDRQPPTASAVLFRVEPRRRAVRLWFAPRSARSDPRLASRRLRPLRPAPRLAPRSRGLEAAARRRNKIARAVAGSRPRTTPGLPARRQGHMADILPALMPLMNG